MWMDRLDQSPVFVHVMYIVQIIHNNIRVKSKFFSWYMNFVSFCCLSVLSASLSCLHVTLGVLPEGEPLSLHSQPVLHHLAIFLPLRSPFPHFMWQSHWRLSYHIKSFVLTAVLFPGFYSWRNTTNGSWFMQALCCELQEKGTSVDILTLLTFVIQRVALDFESNTPGNKIMHQQKQIPCVTTMLTRLLHFTRK